MDLQAVIFDYGEVLSVLPDPQAHSNLLAITGVPEGAFAKVVWAPPGLRRRYPGRPDLLATVAHDTGVSSRPNRSGNCWNRIPSCG